MVGLALLLLGAGAGVLRSLAGPAGNSGPGAKQRASMPTEGASTASEFQLRFRLPAGMSWPAGAVPEVYSESERDRAQHMWQPMHRGFGQAGLYSKDVRSVGKAEFAIRLQKAQQPFYVAVNVPRFLRFFERGPFTLANVKNGELEIALEKPVSLEVHFDIGVTRIADLPFDQPRLTVLRLQPGTKDSYLFAAAPLHIPVNGRLQITGLAAGEFLVRLQTHAKPGVEAIPDTNPPVNPGELHDSKKLKLAAGETGRVDFHYAIRH
jgi:hypothetical protein